MLTSNADARIVQTVIWLVGLVAVLAVAGIISLAMQGKEIPDALSTIGATALGALGAMLTTTRTGGRREEIPTPIPVVNAPGDKLEVTEETPAKDSENES